MTAQPMRLNREYSHLAQPDVAHTHGGQVNHAVSRP